MPPAMINSFLESYDLTDKIVIFFCTSSSDGIENSVTSIKASSKNAAVLDGLAIRDGDMESDQTEIVRNWLEDLGFYE